MKYCNMLQSTNNTELVYTGYWENVITKNKIYLPSNQQIHSSTFKFLCINETGEYYESTDIKSEYQLKRWSKNFIKNENEKLLFYDRSGIILCITGRVNLESIKTEHNGTIEFYNQLLVLLQLVDEHHILVQIKT